MSLTFFLLTTLFAFSTQTDDDFLEKCKTVSKLSYHVTAEVKECWPLNQGNWYGGGSEVNQMWPINNHTHADSWSVVGGTNLDEFTINSRFWLNSNGYAIYVEEQVPLFIQMQYGEFCLVAKNDFPYNQSNNLDLTLSPPTLVYTICRGNNLTSLFLDVSSLVFDRSKKTPDTSLFSTTIWSTLPALQEKIDDTSVTEFSKNINAFTGWDYKKLLHIPSGWESCFGEFQFDSHKFPNPVQTLQQVKSFNFRVALSVHPFISRTCLAVYVKAARNQYLVLNPDRSPFTLLIKGNPLTSVVDFTEAMQTGAANWWMDRLKTLKIKNSIDSFFFEYGEIAWLGTSELLWASSILDYPKNYIAAASTFGPLTVVQAVTEATQMFPLFVQMPKKRNDWNFDGINSVIASAFQMGLAGYPFFIPEVVGGSELLNNSKPDRNLYIRWMQLNTFMPVLHFSYGPWEYDDDVINIAKKMYDLRRDYQDKFTSLAQEAVTSGSPIIRPLWWIAPIDPKCHQINDQFLVGNDLMVAPVVDSSKKKVVYFPDGTTWYNPVDKVYEYGGKSKEYDVALDQLLYFTRV